MNYGPWKIWNGGECPVVDVGFDTIECVFNAGKHQYIRANTKELMPVYKWKWNADVDGGVHIIAYREVIEPEKVEHQGYISELNFMRGGHSHKGDHRNFTLTVQGDTIKAEWAE